MSFYTLKTLCARGAQLTMLLLLKRIKERAPATYGEIARMLQKHLGLGRHKIFPTHIGWVAGDIMHRIQEKFEDTPLINILIVSQHNGMPGTGSYGFIEDYLELPKRSIVRMSPRERKSLIHRLWDEVFDYKEWENIYKKVFKDTLDAKISDDLEKFMERDGKPESWGGRGGGESAYHKNLKKYVFDNPKCIALTANRIKSKTMEQSLLSGDSIDVFFSTKGPSYVVEVKSRLSSDDDLKRGVYQCLKYRVVLAAQNEKEFTTSDIVPVLVSERDLPIDLQKLAKRLGIETRTVRVN